MAARRGLAALVVGAVVALLSAPTPAQDAVNIGYQRIYNLWKVAIANGSFEQETGREISWRLFDSGAKVISAIAAGEVQIALAGSSPIAAGVSRGIDIEVIWIAEDIADAEALVVRDGAGITAPQDLRGKRIAVPFASTTHFHLLFALEQFGIDPKEVTLVDMQPPDIVTAWDNGEIDAAFVWEPALGELKRTGKVLLTSGLLSRWGRATFDGIVASRQFAAAHPDFMCRFVKVLARTVDDYRAHRDAWTPDSPPVQAIVKLVGGDPADVPRVLSQYRFPSLDEQLSPRWLGAGEDGGAARALRYTAEFLKAERKIPAVLGDYGRAVNPRWAQMVRDGAC